MFDGLLFDLDGTLWDSVDAICVSWGLVLERRAPELAGLMTRENEGYVLKFKSLELLGQLRGLFTGN